MSRSEPGRTRVAGYESRGGEVAGVGQVLAAMAHRQGQRRRDVEPHWIGTPGPAGSALTRQVDALRQIGVVPWVAGRGRPEADTLIVDATDLPATVAASGRTPDAPAVAVRLGEPAELGDTLRELLSLAAAGRLRWLMGTRPGLAAFERSAAGSGVELAAVERVPLPTDPGAADGYAGAYLLSRLSGDEAATAHKAATAYTEELAANGQPCPELDLNQLFADLIDRSSERADEGRLFDRVRRAAGFVVCSGGQTGVGQVALQSAARLGLPSFGILPQGRRTETTEGLWPGPDHFANAHLEVLDAHSYRFRTWASVYAADATLLWDFHEGEGCAAARDACRALGRPYLDLAPLTDPAERRRRMWDFLSRHAVRVVNVEGNRGSLLSPSEVDRTSAETLDLFRMAASRRVAPDGRAAARRPPVRRDRLAVGAPNVAAQRDLCLSFLDDAYGLGPPGDRELVVSYPDPPWDLVFARARDLPELLAEGGVDLVLCGSDLLDAAEHTIVLDTGLSPLLQALVGRSGDAGAPLQSLLAARRVGSQDVTLATKLLREAAGYRGEVRGIQGAAETWIRRGLIDLAVDTWSTGATAQANGLRLLHVLGSSSLALAVSGRRPRHPGAAAFVGAFSRWLRAE